MAIVRNGGLKVCQMEIKTAPLSPRNVYNDDKFKNKLFEFIKEREGSKNKIYIDSEGLPTIGVGYLLMDKDNKQQTWKSDFKQAGINLSEEQVKNLDKLLKDLAKIPRNEKIEIGEKKISKRQDWIDKHYYNNKLNNQIEILQEQEEALFDVIIPRYKNVVKEQIGDKAYNDLKNSDEMIILVSLAFNNPNLIGPNLTKTIKDGDRAAAWYEIRYNSNKTRHHGLQNRRVAESNNFGLYYDESNITKQEANDI